MRRYNVEGVAGLFDRPKGHRAEWLSDAEQAALAAAEAHPGKRLRVFFQDEARFGQKGRLCHRWWLKASAPPGLCDQRFDWTYLFAAVGVTTALSIGKCRNS